MKLRKEVGELTICNVNKEVYEILEVTGFTSILNVKKALREVSVEGCELIGEGGNGELVLIDMPMISIGPPICDLVATYRDMIVAPAGEKAKHIERSTGMPADMCLKVGNMFFMKYTGITDPEQLKEYYQKLGLLFAFNTVMICGSGASKARKLAPLLMDKLLRGIVIPNEQTIKYLFQTM